MPLFKGRKNIGRNIAKEIAAGKPLKQAKAIGITAAIGPMAKRVRTTKSKTFKAASKKW